MAHAAPCRSVMSLRDLCLSQLVAARSLLGDIGDVPADLLEPVLSQCNAQQLSAIEDDTRAGGRDISADLQLHWQRLLVQQFGAASCTRDSGSGSTGDSGRGSGSGGGGSGGGTWRAVYDAKAAQLAEKEQRIREKCQRMFEQEREAKQQRCTQVIAIQPGWHGVKGRRAALQKAVRRPEMASIRHSILKKLGFAALAPSAAKPQPASRGLAPVPSRAMGLKAPGRQR